MQILLALVVVPALCGCAIRTGPAPDRLTSARSWYPDESAWPDRYVQPLVEIANRPAEQRSPEGETTAKRLREAIIGQAGVVDTRSYYRGVYGMGVIRELLPMEAITITRDGVTTTYRKSPHRQRQFNFVSTDLPQKEFSTRASRQQERGDLTGLLIRLTDINLWLPDSEPRGLVVHLCSLYKYSPYEGEVRKELFDRGWAILEVGHPTSIHDESLFVLNLERAGAADNVLSEPSEKTLQAIANHIEDRVAEWAYAVEAALLMLEDVEPELADKPVVLMGFSLGALVLPTVAARIPDRLDAAVLIAGGVNMFYILNRPVIRNGVGYRGLQVFKIEESRGNEFTLRPLDRRLLKSAADAYLDFAAIDPYHTAAALRDKPVLMLHGMFDNIIPEETGGVLYERLGRPERWSYPFGHLGLFWWLPNESRRIADWIESTVQQSAD